VGWIRPKALAGWRSPAAKSAQLAQPTVGHGVHAVITRNARVVVRPPAASDVMRCGGVNGYGTRTTAGWRLTRSRGPRLTGADGQR
jgi:hypothetical protein